MSIVACKDASAEQRCLLSAPCHCNFMHQAYVKQRVWQPRHCDAMCFLVRVYCAEISIATVCVSRHAVWDTQETQNSEERLVCVCVGVETKVVEHRWLIVG